jgi:DNA-binding MarR family transcriptional regulator
MVHYNHEEAAQFRERMRAQLRILSGVEDTSGIELSQMVRVAANMYDAVTVQLPDGDELSDPRWRLLLYLKVAEELGNSIGMTPSSLSKHQNISKNAVSSLLRGLEEQGLIEREIDGTDKRFFRIHLSAAGRTLVMEDTPVRATQLNRITDSLTRAEKAQLAGLLAKLMHAMIANSDVDLECVED